MASPNHPFWDFLSGRSPGPPVFQLLGCKVLEAELGSGFMKVQFEGKPEFTNAIGSLQGGILAAMLDQTAGQAIMTTLEESELAPTLEIKVNFIKPAKVGPLFAEGKVVHRGRSIVYAEAKLTDSEGELLATASSTARIVNAPSRDSINPGR
jgi:uncharacterized protein (TIGR00369 family)